MSINWSSLTFTPSEEAVQQLAESWSWLLREPFKPVLFSILGDVFFELESGGLWRLDTGTGEVTRITDSADRFLKLLATPLVDEWFMPNLIEKLHEAGKIPGPGECYTYVTLPVFAEGKYEVENLNPVPAHEHFAITGKILGDLQSLPSGTKVNIRVEP